MPARGLLSCFALRKFLRHSDSALRHSIVIRHSAGVDDSTHPTNIAHGDFESGGMMMARADSVKTNPRHKSGR
jgi:hypothetical protein